MIEKSKADRLAELRGEIQERIEEVRQLIHPERAHMLYPAWQAVERECSRGFNEAEKAEAEVKAWLARGNESQSGYIAEHTRIAEVDVVRILEALREAGEAECVSASRLWRASR